jgi:GT2 family glycosyltransferase
MEIILVDGKSNDRTLIIAKRILDNVEVNSKILSDEGKGLGYARQLVLDNANGKYICWFDGDNIVIKDFIKNHVKFILPKSLAGMAIPITLSHSDKLVARLEMYNWLIPTLNAFYKGKTPPAMMQGTITSVAVLKEVGGFNIALIGSGEDVDLIGKLIQAGYKIVVNPNAIIYHTMRESWKEVLNQMRWYGRTQPRRPYRVVLAESAVSLVLKNKNFVSFVRYFRDPVFFLLPLFSFFQHMAFLVCYFSHGLFHD